MIDSPKIESEYNIIKWNAVAWSLGSMNICSRRTKVFSMRKLMTQRLRSRWAERDFSRRRRAFIFFISLLSWHHWRARLGGGKDLFARICVWSRQGAYLWPWSYKDWKQKRNVLVRDKIAPSFSKSPSRNGRQGPLKKKSETASQGFTDSSYSVMGPPIP